jgi:DNA-binding response OmpR family regulator
MSIKVLVADDSPTINKVIKIILAQENCELSECLKESDFEKSLEQKKPDLLFLDFTFSDKKSGYDLAKRVSEIVPQTKTVLLFGTFDTVDKQLMSHCGAVDSLIKPFDSHKFLQVFKSLQNHERGKTLNLEKEVVQNTVSAKTLDLQFLNESDQTDQWTISGQAPLQSTSALDEAKRPVVSLTSNPASKNLGSVDLKKSLDDWGIQVPNVIGNDSKVIEKPPIIENEVASSFHVSEKILDIDSKSPKSKFISINELNMSGADESEKTLPKIELAGLAGLEDEGAKLIEKSIEDEIDKDLWAVDTFEDNSAFTFEAKQTSPVTKREMFEINSNLNKEERATQIFSDSNVNVSEERLRQMIQQAVESVVKEFCRDRIEKVAWEVIPDLAENIIKAEIKNLADKSRNDF